MQITGYTVSTLIDRRLFGLNHLRIARERIHLSHEQVRRLLQTGRSLRKTCDLTLHGTERPEPGDPVWVVKVPLIFRDADEIANSGIARPCSTQCSSGQFSGNSRLQKRDDVGICSNRVN